MLFRAQEKILSVKVKLRLRTVHLSTISEPTRHAFILTGQDVLLRQHFALKMINFGKNALKASEPNKQTGYFMLSWLIFILCASNSDVSSRLSVRLT